MCATRGTTVAAQILLFAMFFPLASWTHAADSEPETKAADTKPAETQPAVASQAKMVTFIIDASADMADRIGFVKTQMSAAVDRLKPTQYFAIYFIQNDKYAEFGFRMVPATVDNKKNAVAFIQNVTTHGGRNPIPAIERAFRLHPQLVYLLSGGDFSDDAAVLTKIRALNQDNRIKINPLMVTVEPDDELWALFQKIAEDTDGVPKHVKPDVVTPTTTKAPDAK